MYVLVVQGFVKTIELTRSDVSLYCSGNVLTYEMLENIGSSRSNHESHQLLIIPTTMVAKEMTLQDIFDKAIVLDKSTERDMLENENRSKWW
jgi:hypothetical protein